MTDHPFDLLERELDEAAARLLAPAPAPAQPRRGRLRMLLVALAAVLGTGAAAWAASALLSSGDPVAYRYGAPPSPDAHYGTTVPGSVQMLADDVPDPDGGLPWGLRTFTTSRGFGCIQVGRVQEGKLGVLALVQRGGALRARGLFHELRAAVLSQATTCIPLDGAGRAFVALHTRVTTAGVPVPCLHRAGERDCPEQDIRTIDAGLLGPRAEAIAFRVGGATRTARALGDVGGYLVVQRLVKPVTIRRGSLELVTETPVALTPGSRVIRRVAYRGAPACTVRPTTNRRGACPDPPGFTLVPQPDPGDLRATVSAFAAPDRRGIRLRFRAPTAVTDGRSAYAVLIRGPGPGPFGTQLERNVAAGELVRTTVDLPSIGKHRRPALRPGSYRVEVSYLVQPPRPRIDGSLAYPGYRVGSARFVVR